MKYIKALTVAVLFCSLTAQADRHEEKEAMKAAADTACSQDAATAGCGDKKVGTGLLRCLKGYKKANKDFKLSDACKEATKNMKEARKDHRANKKTKK